MDVIELLRVAGGCMDERRLAEVLGLSRSVTRQTLVKMALDGLVVNRIHGFWCLSEAVGRKARREDVLEAVRRLGGCAPAAVLTAELGMRYDDMYRKLRALARRGALRREGSFWCLPDASPPPTVGIKKMRTITFMVMLAARANGGCVTPSAVAKLVGSPRQNVAALLIRMLKKGVVVRRQRGLYCLRE